MTVGAWLQERLPAPPPRLAKRIQDVLGDRIAQEVETAPDLCVEAAQTLLRDLLSRPTAGRESALDLLVVDALVTYAFEAAASEPSKLEARAERAMTRLSHVAQ